MANEKKSGGLFGFVALFLVLMGLGRNGGTPPPPPPPPGPVTVAGTVTSVDVSQAARMGAHMLPKLSGALISVVTTWTAATSRGGVGIAWPYRIIVRFGHSTTFGWKLAGELGFPESGIRTINQTRAPGLWTETAAITPALTPFVTPNDPNVTWDVHVELLAAQSDAAGNPLTTSYQSLQEMKHDGAVRISPGAAQLGGGVSTVDVFDSVALAME